eukprot:Phypoly_transcript_08584.p1 GENE.Phypoly_transcript_08584~~Phypoly_transcript_08584.p1  ORF type:complete len:485 (+),score=154.58 Phypoly_transcript_08584:54-1457(+)
MEGGAEGEQGEEYVAETETSQVEGGEEGEADENNTTYNTDVVEEEVPTQVDPEAATLEDIFGADDDDEEPEPEQQIQEDIPEDDLDEVQYRPQLQAIGSPLRLVTNPLPTPPEDTLVVRVKLPNIIGIQSKPYTPQSLEEELNSYEDEDDEGRKKKHGVPESQIRWRHVEGTDVKESNARIVRWSDGSMHLMLGNELLDMTMHDLHAEHLYLYARQPGFLHSQGRLNKKVVIRPASLDNKLHQKLSMSLAERNQKVSKVKLVTTTADPEVEKARREKAEEERIRRAQGETAAKNRIMRQYGLEASYLEQTGDYDEPPAPAQPMRRERERERERTYRDNSRNLDDFIVDDEEEDEDLEDRRASKKKRRPEVEEDTDRLMNAKRDLSPEPKKSRKEKEKRKVRKGAKEEEAEESKEEEKAEEEGGETQTGGEAGGEEGGGEEEEEEVNIVKRPTKARRGVIVDDDEAET